MPLVRTTWARCGHTPALFHRAHQRDKVSVTAALTLSPHRGHLGLYYQTFPDTYVDAELYTFFLRRLLRQIRGPMMLLHDGGNMHKGPLVSELSNDFPRLEINRLPPYAPELNPVEPLWGHAKNEELANFAPLDTDQLEQTVSDFLDKVRNDQDRLRSFFTAAELPWAGLTGLM